MAWREIVARVSWMASVPVGAFLLAFGCGGLIGSIASPSLEQPIGGYLTPSADAPAREDHASSPEARATGESASGLIAAESAEAVFVQRAAPRNTLLNSTYLDHPSTNGNPEAFILVRPTPEPGGDAEDSSHAIGVWYDSRREGRWAIFNQHRAPLAAGATFKVVVVEGSNTIVHRATPRNSAGNRTYIDDPLANGNPDAMLSVTQNWNPEGVGDTYNDHPVGVRYDAGEKKWTVFNRDREPMPDGAAFNVAVLRDGS